MDSRAAAEGFPSSSDIQESLQSTFQHPAGLQTARGLVQAVARHWFSRHTHLPSTITTFSDASPEVEGILSSILMFRDSQSETPQEGHFNVGGMETTGDVMDIDTAEVLQSLAGSSANSNSLSGQANNFGVPAGNLPFSSSSLENSHLLSGGQSFCTVSVPYKTSDKSPESEIRSIFGSKAVNNSLLQGTESPYRVESPAVQAASASATPFQPSAQQLHRENRPKPYETSRESGARGSHFSTSEWENEACRRTQAVDLRERSYGGVHLAAQVLEARTEDGASSSKTTLSDPLSEPLLRNFNTNSPSQLLPYAGLAGIPVQPSTLAKISPSIKSFLAVNKSVTNNKESANARETHFYNRSTSQSDLVTITSSINLNQTRESFQENFFSSLQSPSPPPSFATPQLRSSPNITDLSSPNLSDTEMDSSNPKLKTPSRKRKTDADGAAPKVKKQKADDTSKKAAKKAAKSKEPKPEQAKERLPQAIFMRILEFTPPSFLSKARLISKSFKGMVDEFDSIFVNCRKENYGWDMPAPPKGLTERQYSDLFGGKGCLEPGCTDEKSSRTHWSWAKRWCQDCWKSKIEREDRALKKYQGQYGRVTLTKLFECIPVGIHDSFLKPHDYIDNFESRSRQAPRLYKYYLASDIQQVINDYEALTPSPFVEDPNHTAAQNATARAAHQTLMGELDEKRNQFFAVRKQENDDHMMKVQKIETAIKEKREENRRPNDGNREARKALFLRRAQEDLPHIAQDFLKESKAFKAATRIFRDPGSERGWQTLKPKIEKEWEEESHKKPTGPVTGLDGVMENTEPAINHEPVAQEPTMLQPQRSMMHQRPGYSPHGIFGPGSSITDLGSSMNFRNNSVTSHLQHASGMYPANAFNRNPSHMTYLGASYLPQTGFGNSVNNSYANHPNQYQHNMMGAHSANNHSQNSQAPQNMHQGSYQATRDMSIHSVLSEPIRLNFNPNPDPRFR